VESYVVYKNNPVVFYLAFVNVSADSVLTFFFGQCKQVKYKT